MPDYTKVLGDIRTQLKAGGGEAKSVSDLVGEVRDSLRGAGEPTVRTSIVNMQNAIMAELQRLRTALTGGAGTPAGGLPQKMKDTSPLLEKEVKATTDLHGDLLQIQRELAALTELGGMHGSGGGRGITHYELQALSRRVQDVVSATDQSVKSTTGMLRDMFSKLFGADGEIQSQYKAQMQRAGLNLLNLSTRTLDVINIFERLETFIRRNIIERYSGYLSNRAGSLSASDYYLDDIKRIFGYLKGSRENVGFGMTATQEGVKQSLQSGMASPMMMYGKNVEQLSGLYKQVQDDLVKRGVNVRGFGSPEQLQTLTDTITGMRNASASGPFQQMHSQAFMSAQATISARLIDIAKNTGMSADQLIKLVQSTTQEVSELSALGLLSEQEAKNYGTNKNALAAMGEEGKELASWASKWMASGRDPSKFAINNPEVRSMEPLSQGQLTQLLSQTSNLLTSDKDFKTQIYPQLVKMANQSSGIARNSVGQFAGLNDQVTGLPMQVFARLGGALTRIGNLSPELAPASKTGAADTISQSIEVFGKQIPMFKDGVNSFVGVVWDLVKNIGTFYAAMKLASVFGGGAGGAGAAAAEGGIMAAGGGALARYLGTLTQTVTKLAGPVLGGAGGAISAAMNGASASGIAGAGVGGAGGAYAGGIAGAAIGGPIAPLTGIIGAALGGWLGSHYGQMGGEAIGGAVSPSPAAAAPAVPPPQNIVGPDQTALAATTSMSDMTRNLHGEQMQVLSGILNANTSANGILAQMYSELQVQSRAAVGQPATNSAQLPARGLVSNTSAVNNANRPEAGYPYGAAAY